MELFRTVPQIDPSEGRLICKYMNFLIFVFEKVKIGSFGTITEKPREFKVLL